MLLPSPRRAGLRAGRQMQVESSKSRLRGPRGVFQRPVDDSPDEEAFTQRDACGRPGPSQLSCQSTQSDRANKNDIPTEFR